MSSPEPPPQAAPPPGEPVSSQSRLWPYLALVVLGPPFFTALAAVADNRGDMAPAAGLLLGGAGGIAAGILLGCRLGRTPGSRFLLSLALAGVMTVVVVTMACVGCMVAGYALNFH